MRRAYIVADTREACSGIPDILSEKADVILQQLPVGDYILSERVAVERKRTDDFLDSLIRKRLFDQVDRLTDAYEKPVFILENEGLFLRNVDNRAIYGVIACLLTDYGLPIIRTRDAMETASIIYTIALREQFRHHREISLRGKPPHMNLADWQQFIIEGLPNVSVVLAQRMLTSFGSVRAVLTATNEELQEVHGIGKKKARIICDILDAKWDSHNQDTNADSEKS